MARFEQDISGFTKAVEYMRTEVSKLRSEFAGLISDMSRSDTSTAMHIGRSAVGVGAADPIAASDFLSNKGRSEATQLIALRMQLAEMTQRMVPDTGIAGPGSFISDSGTIREKLGKGGFKTVATQQQFDAAKEYQDRADQAAKDNSDKARTDLDIALAKLKASVSASPQTSFAKKLTELTALPGGQIGAASQALHESMTTNIPKAQKHSAVDMFSKSYGLADLPRMMDVKSQMGGVVESLNKIDDNNRNFTTTQTTVLKALQKAIEENSHEFGEAMKAFQAEARKGDVSAPTQDRLRKQMSEMDMLREKSEELKKTIPGLSDGGGGPGPNFFERMMRNPVARGIGAGLGAAIGIGTSAYSMYFDGTQQMGGIVSGGPLRRINAEGETSAIKYRRELESQDMTNPDNLIKYRGDLLFRTARPEYLGTKGLKNAERVGFEIAAFERNMEKRAYENASGMGMIGKLPGILGAGLQGAALGAMGGAAFAGVGAVPGAILGFAAGAGISALSASKDVMHQQISNRYSQELGFQTGLSGVAGKVAFGSEFGGLSREAQRAVLSERGVEGMQISDALKEAELKKYLPYKLALNESQHMYEAERDGAVLVGAFAATRKGMMGMYGVSAESKLAYEKLAEDQQRLEYQVDRTKKAEGDLGGRTNRFERGREIKDMEGSTGPVGGSIRADRAARREMEKYDRLEESEEGPAAPPGSKAPTGNPEADRVITKEEVRKKVDFNSFNAKIAQQESGNRYDVWGKEKVRGGGYAYGKYQFIPGTRQSLARQMGINENDFILTGDPEKDELAKKNQERGMALLNEERLRKYVEYANSDNPTLRANVRAMSPEAAMAAMHNIGPGNFRKEMITGERTTGEDIAKYTKPFGGLKGAQSTGELSDQMGKDRNKLDAMLAAERDTLLTKLDMSGTEFMRNQNQLTNVLGGGRASLGDTAKMTMMGRSGLGSFDQLMGNISQINAISGGTNNIDRLEQVLASAVEAGFNKSRVAQAFVQTTNQLAQQAGVVDVGTMADFAGNAASFMGAGQLRADERSLREAATGIANFNSATGATEGVMGAVKSAAVLGAGGTIANGALGLIDLNYSQAVEVEKELASGNIKSIAARRAAGGQAGNTSERNQAALKQTRALIDGMKATLRGQLGIHLPGGKSPEEILENIKRGGPGAMTPEQFVTVVGNAARPNMGVEAGEAYAVEMLTKSQAISKDRAAAIVAERSAKGNEIFVDPASQGLRRYIDKSTRMLNLETKGVSENEYRDFLKATNNQPGLALMSGKQQGQAITAQLLDDAKNNKELQQSINETFKNSDRLDLVRGASMQVAQQENAQSVRISNVTELAAGIATVMAEKTTPKTAGKKVGG